MGHVFITSKQRFDAFRAAHGASSADAGVANEGRASLALVPARSSRLRALRIWLRPHRRTLALIVVLGLSSIAIDMLWPLASRYMVDHVLLRSGLPFALKARRLAWIAASIAVLF